MIPPPAIYKRPKTLVVLTPAFPPDETPANWVITQQLFVKTAKELFPGLQLTVLSFYYPYTVSSYDWHGVRVASFNGTAHRKMRRVVFWKRIWKKLATIRREYDIIGLFSFWCGECALAGHYFGRRYKIRHYCWLCGQDARKSNKLVKFIRPRPDELIAMSDFLADEFHRNHGIRPLRMIPNGIDTREFAPLHDATGAPAHRDIDILGVGNLSGLKQYILFVDIIRSLRGSLPDIRAVLCGEGEEKENIRAAGVNAGISTHLSLLGETPHLEAIGYMQRARVFLHTSSYEGFGVACLEALYAGAHVISFVKPVKKDIPHWHVVSTPEEMTEKARELLLSPQTEYDSVHVYSMQESVRHILQLYPDFISIV